MKLDIENESLTDSTGKVWRVYVASENTMAIPYSKADIRQTLKMVDDMRTLGYMCCVQDYGCMFFQQPL